MAQAAVTQPDGAALAAFHTLGDDPVPDIVLGIAAGRRFELAWRNELGGLTFRIGDAFLKWNPPATGVDLERERLRLGWLAGRHPAPRVLDHGSDGKAQWPQQQVHDTSANATGWTLAAIGIAITRPPARARSSLLDISSRRARDTIERASASSKTRRRSSTPSVA